MSKPAILRPYIPDEGMSAAEAADFAKVHRKTIGDWAEKHHIGRVISRNVVVSRVALQAFLEGEQEILDAYLSGDRESPDIRRLYARLGIHLPAVQHLAVE